MFNRITTESLHKWQNGCSQKFNGFGIELMSETTTDILMLLTKL